MSIDLSALSYLELVDLHQQVKDALIDRKAKEESPAKRAWFRSEAAKPFLERLQSLQTTFDKLAAKTNKSKAVTLKVAMSVDINPPSFEKMLNYRWKRDVSDFLDVDCKGKLLNKEDCGKLGNEVQRQIDNVMSDVCGDAVGLHGDLSKDWEAFVDEYNDFVEEFNASQPFNISPADLVKANKPKAKKGKK